MGFDCYDCLQCGDNGVYEDEINRCNKRSHTICTYCCPFIKLSCGWDVCEACPNGKPELCCGDLYVPSHLCLPCKKVDEHEKEKEELKRIKAELEVLKKRI